MKKMLLLLNVFFLSIFSLYSQWSAVNGVGNPDVFDIASNENYWFLLSENGLYQSSDKGITWGYNNNLTTQKFGDLNCIITVRDTIYIGSDSGLYYSTDSGLSWELIIDGIIESNGKFVPNIVDLQYYDNTLYALSVLNFYKFDKINKKFTLIEVNKSPYNYISFHLSDKIFITGGATLDYNPSRDPNVYISLDRGISWDAIIDSTSGIDVTDILCITAQNDTLYAGTRYEPATAFNGKSGIYMSSDSGYHWQFLENGLEGKEVRNILITDEGIFAGTKTGIYYTNEFGNEWVRKNSGLTGLEIYKLKKIEGKIFACTHLGLFCTTNKGDNWTLMNNGLIGGFLWSFDNDNQKIYAYSLEDGIYSSADTGKTWKLYVEGNKLVKWGVVGIDGNCIYTASNQHWEMFYSLDAGNSWSMVPNNEAIGGKRINKFKITDHKILALTDKGVYISKDSAKTWESMYPALDNYNFNFLKFYDNNIYAGTPDGLLLISSDKGSSWRQDTSIIKDGTPLVDIFDLLKIENQLFLATFTRGIFKSTDNGMSWDSVNNGLLNREVWDLEEYNKNIFAATKDGVFLTTDLGESWQDISEGLYTSKYVKALLIKSDFILAGTTSGMYKAKLSDFGITGVIDNQTEIRNYLYSYPPYPTPSKNVVNTLIYWDTSIDIDNDQIDIIDIFGNKVGDKKDITINMQSPYNGILTWNCSGVLNGIYFILINHGTEKRAIKVLVNK